MGEKNKYWEDLTSGLYDPDERSIIKTSEEKLRELGPVYQWAVELKSQLKRVFLWDHFDKKEARLRLDYRLSSRNHRFIRLSRQLWFRAAVILMAVLSGVLLHSLISGSFQGTRYTEIVVPLGQMTQINLSDGSKVWLNSGSVFKYPTEFDQSVREVYLDGEAFMEVARDERSPFVTYAKNFSVEVLGTSFNVSAYSADARASLTLVEGSVLLRSGDKRWDKILAPGQIAEMTNGGIPVVSSLNTTFYTSWKDGKIVFRNETMEEIARKLERWYNVEIRFEDEQLKNMVFSGTFLKNKPVEQVFRSLSIMNESIDFVYETRSEQKNIINIIKKRKYGINKN